MTARLKVVCVWVVAPACATGGSWGSSSYGYGRRGGRGLDSERGFGGFGLRGCLPVPGGLDGERDGWSFLAMGSLRVVSMWYFGWKVVMKGDRFGGGVCSERGFWSSKDRVFLCVGFDCLIYRGK